MQAIWRWSFICAGVIILIDLATALLSAGQSSENDTVAVVQTVDLVASISLYFYCGYRVGSATRVVRSAAEAGVLCGALAGVAAIAMGFAIPPPLDTQSLPPITDLALNVAMGGVLAILSGFFAARQPQPRR